MIARVIGDAATEDEMAKLEAAIDYCPVNAISL